MRAKYVTAQCHRISRSCFVAQCTLFCTHRPSVPTSHDYTKSFFVALRRAWFVFDEDRLQLVKAVLWRDDQLTDSQIDAKMYYDFAFFHDRVPRRVPPPAEHYRHVRAGFALLVCPHKQRLAAIGAWPCGVETGDCLLSEWRHRYNHRIVERGRPWTRDWWTHFSISFNKINESTCSVDGCLLVTSSTHQSSWHGAVALGSIG